MIFKIIHYVHMYNYLLLFNTLYFFITYVYHDQRVRFVQIIGKPENYVFLQFKQPTYYPVL